jgi:DNA-binding NarL/FixJ family response regulator
MADSTYARFSARWLEGEAAVNEHTAANGIRLILLDNQALFRESLARFLASQPGLEVAGECADADQALEILRTSAVDVVLLDFNFVTEGEDGFLFAARRAGYEGRFLIVSGTADARRSATAIKLGASGIFLKSEAPDRLVQAIQLVAAGAVWLDQRVVRVLADELVDRVPQLDHQESVTLLTEREQKVLLGILGGLTNRKIGDNLGLSEGSIKALVQQLFSKTGVRTRSQLVRVALQGSLKAVNGAAVETRP